MEKDPKNKRDLSDKSGGDLYPQDRLGAFAVGSAASLNRVTSPELISLAKEAIRRNPEEAMDIIVDAQLKQFIREGLIEIYEEKKLDDGEGKK